MKGRSPRTQPKADPLTRHLRNCDRKVTGPRRAILRLLERQEHPICIRDLHARLSAAKCDLATVYRSMRLLEGLGLVKRFDFGDGVARFELNRPGSHSHHHHLICTGCSAIVEINDCFATDLEERIAAGNGFARITHKLEFFGVCPKCQIE